MQFPNFACTWFTLEGKRTLTSNKKKIKHAAETSKLLEVVQVPLQVAVRHCLGHQKEGTEMARETVWLNGQRKGLIKECF